MIGNKKHFMVAGASGLVGSALLADLLANDEVGKVTALVRSKMDINHKKLQQQSVDYDLMREAEIAPNVDAVLCCLGTTIANAGSKEAFKTVDYNYVVKLAVFAQRQGIPQFHVVSAAGAKDDSRFFYSKVKGRMENELRKLTKIKSIYIYRPSMLLGERDEFRLGESIGKFFMKTLSFLLPKSIKAIYDSQVASAMAKRAIKPKSGIWVVTNADMHSE